MIAASRISRSTSRPVIAATLAGSKPPKGLPERVPFPEHDRPAQPDLEHTKGECFEHRGLVVAADTPDIVVVAREGCVAGAGPDAAWLSVVADDHVASHRSARLLSLLQLRDLCPGKCDELVIRVRVPGETPAAVGCLRQENPRALLQRGVARGRG